MTTKSQQKELTHQASLAAVARLVRGRGSIGVCQQND